MAKRGRKSTGAGSRANTSPPVTAIAAVPHRAPIQPPPPDIPRPAPTEPANGESVVPEPTFLFEIAWEVCWQLGGIYTVLRTKAAAMLERWGDNYCLIGPYNPQTAAVEFEEMPTE